MEFIAKDGKKFDNLADAERHEAQLDAEQQAKVKEVEEFVAQITDYLKEHLALSCVTVVTENDEQHCTYIGCADSSYDNKGAQIYVQALIEEYQGNRYEFINNHPTMNYTVSNYTGAVIKKMAFGLATKFAEGKLKQLDELVFHDEEDDVEYLIHIGDDLQQLLGVSTQNCCRTCTPVGHVHIVPISSIGSLEDIIRMLANC